MPSWRDLNFTKCIFFFGGFSGSIFWRIFWDPMPWIPCPVQLARRRRWSDSRVPHRRHASDPPRRPTDPGLGSAWSPPFVFASQRRRPRGERRERPPTKGSRVWKLLLNEGTRDWMSAFYFLPHLLCFPKRYLSLGLLNETTPLTILPVVEIRGPRADFADLEMKLPPPPLLYHEGIRRAAG